jgi:CubicO group peptidase (beta-lactamase class C family)
VFAPLGVKACLNWIGCGPDMQARAVTLYRDTGEVARDAPGDLPPNCTIPVLEGAACDLDAYVPGTNASIFSPQGGVRIGMIDLAKIGQVLLRPRENWFISSYSYTQLYAPMVRGRPGDGAFFCTYGLGIQLIEAPERDCTDKLFGDGRPRVGHSGEAYALQSGVWVDGPAQTGFAYFLTEAAPPPGGEDTGGFTPREKALMARAQALLGEKP